MCNWTENWREGSEQRPGSPKPTPEAVDLGDHWPIEKWLSHLESFSEYGTTNARAAARRVRALLATPIKPTPAVERLVAAIQEEHERHTTWRTGRVAGSDALMTRVPTFDACQHRLCSAARAAIAAMRGEEG